VFDEARADEFMSACFGTESDLTPKFNVQRMPALNGLILAHWTLTLTRDEKKAVPKDGADGVMRSLVARVNAVLSSSEGFVVKTVEFKFTPSPGGAVITDVLASGLLPCHAASKPQGGP